MKWQRVAEETNTGGKKRPSETAMASASGED